MQPDTRNLAVLILWLILASLASWGLWGLETAATKTDQLLHLLATAIGGYGSTQLLNTWLNEEQEGPKDL